MDVLVWVLVAVFGLNFLVLGWFAGLELLTQHRLNREIRELDELWREFTTVPAGARTHSAHRLESPPAVDPPAGFSPRRLVRGSIGVALSAAFVAVAVFTTPTPGRDRFTSARGPDSPQLAPDEPSLGTGPTRSANPIGSVVDPSVATSPDPGSVAPITTAGGDVPEAVAAESHSSTAIHIEWREVATATAYSIKRADEPPGITTSWAIVAKTSGDVTDYTDQNLEPATTYWYRVSAITTSGSAVASDIVSATTSVAPPEAPSVVAVAASTTVDLSWDDGASETGYRIERSTEDSAGWTVIGTTGMDVTAYTDSALLPETTYLYRVVATNAGGDSPPSAVISVTTLEEKTDGGTVPEPTPGSDNGGGGGLDDGAAAIDDGASAIVEDGVAAIEGGMASAETKAEESLATVEDVVATVDLSSAAATG
ncbi:MAG TPA: fibronectin type III domain-containing protein [Actinomycetota bacterium]|nr:fibronectin type III domain-containing protein [Actinomycetota bacterium]